MSILKFLSKYKWCIFYAVMSGFGLAFALQLLKDYGVDKFLMGVLFTILLLCFEIYLNWRYATKVLRQIDMPSINVYNLWGHFMNHLTLPLLLIISFAGFIFFNEDDLIRIVAICFLTIINLILFVNIHSYYKDEFRLEEETRYIYDLIKLIIFFFGLNLILNIKKYWEVELWIVSLLVCFLALGLGLLLIYRKNAQSLVSVAYVIIVSFGLSVIFMILSFLGVVFFGINIIIFLLFYLALAILHHKIDRTLTINVFIEYSLIIVLVFLLFIGIS